MLEADDVLFLFVAVLECIKGAVVKDRAVLVNLDQSSAVMFSSRAQDRGEVLAVGVHGACHERCFSTEGQGDRIERVVQRTHRRGLGDLALLGSRGVLTLGQTVDAVVEQQDLQVHIAAHRVD
ncbi:unannotated protein [freshwater metagenome]